MYKVYNGCRSNAVNFQQAQVAQAALDRRWGSWTCATALWDQIRWDPTVPAMSCSRRNREPLRTTHLWLIYDSSTIYIHLHPSTSIYSESTQCIVVIWGFDSPGPPLYTDKFPDCADFWEFQLSFFLTTEVVPYRGCAFRMMGIVLLCGLRGDDTGKKKYWKNNCRFPWSSGPLVPWSSGPLVLWSPGPLVPVLWSPSSGPLVPWSLTLLILVLYPSHPLISQIHPNQPEIDPKTNSRQYAANNTKCCR